MDGTTALIITSILALIAAFSLTSLGGLMSERSGVINIALDGKMIIGGMVWATLMATPGFRDGLGSFAPFMGLIIAGLAGAAYSTLFSFATVNMMSDQIITGTALNMIAPALALILTTAIFGKDSISWSSTSAGWADAVNTTAIWFAIIAVVVLALAWFIIAKTKAGLRFKSAGENPYALETAGVSVARTRWISLTIAGFLAAMGGAAAMIFIQTFNGSVNGIGFISLGILILGRWKVWGVGIGALVIAAAMGVMKSWDQIGGGVPEEIMQMIPFILPLLVMILFKIFLKEKEDAAPRDAGKPFKKDIRG